MKKAQKALLATSMAGALLVSAGYGTYSWFTSSTTAAGKIDNGTLSVNNGQAISTKLVQAEKFAPSQYTYGDFVTLDNTGNLEQTLRLTYSASVDKAPADPYKTFYLAYKYKEKPNKDKLLEWRMAWEKGFFAGAHNENLSPTALKTLASSLPALPKGVEVVVGEVVADNTAEAVAVAESVAVTPQSYTKAFKLGNDEFFTLKEDEFIDIAFDVKLSQNAGNEYQGAKYDATLTVQAKQTDLGAKYKNKGE